jgi:hypothetical protein
MVADLSLHKRGETATWPMPSRKFFDTNPFHKMHSVVSDEQRRTAHRPTVLTCGL